MAKKALCCGINAYPHGMELQGCVRDAEGWATLLKHHYDFEVYTMQDAEATKRNMLDGLKTLMTGVQKGDVLAFTNSGHGTYVGDRNQDEPVYDEALCPVDVMDSVIVDDELRELFHNLPSGVRLTVISDSCFSGSVTRALLSEVLPGFQSVSDGLTRLRQMLTWRVRFLNPSLEWMPQRGNQVLDNPMKAKAKMVYNQASMNHLLLSGCKDTEYSYDAKFGSIYAGAMSYYALQAIQQSSYRITYSQLVKSVNTLLTQAGFPQHPQLEGPSNWKRRIIFT